MSKTNEAWGENCIFVARNMSQSKILKIQLVFKILLAGPKSHVRRTIGIIAPDAPCKSQKFRSRIALSKSSPGWEKKTNRIQAKTIRPLTKIRPATSPDADESASHVHSKYAESLPRRGKSDGFVKTLVQQAERHAGGGAAGPPLHGITYYKN